MAVVPAVAKAAAEAMDAQTGLMRRSVMRACGTMGRRMADLSLAGAAGRL